jgi:nucleoside phosphorylase
VWRPERPWRIAALLVTAVAGSLPAGAAAGGRGARGLCASAAAVDAAPPYVAVLSAFPAELAPLVAAAQIDTTVEIDGRPYSIARLDGVRVVLGLTGIGIVNARSRTRALLANVEVAALVMSGVAGSRQRIGDVVLATRWMERGRPRVFRVNPALLALARRAAGALPAPLEQCTPVPPTVPEAPIVCLPHDPAVVFGGHGVSGDPFSGAAFPCTPGAGEIFGCELPVPAAASPAAAGSVAATAAPDAEDMETAAVARVAARRRVPFLGVRAVSDGAGDPLGDRDFPAQFFDYYRLAAHNAGAVTRALVAEIGRLAAAAPAGRTCRLLARHRWRRAAARIRAAEPSTDRAAPP